MAGILLYCAFFAILAYLSAVDVRSGVVPGFCQLILLALAVLSAILLPEPGLKSRLIGALVISLPLLVISFFTDGFGGGDIKLYAVCGLFLGCKAILLAFLISIILAAIFGFAYIKIRRKPTKTRIPFVPFISAGVIASALFGERIVSWYLNLF